MDTQSNIYTEKQLANFQTDYKENVISKPQEISVTITAEHIYGLAFICEQVGTREEDPVYTRFVCNMDEVTKVYVNLNNKSSPIYIQCDDTSKATVSRKRIILPCFKNHAEIIRIINETKAEYDKKSKKPEPAAQPAPELSMNDEFEKTTAEFDLKRAARRAKKDSLTTVIPPPRTEDLPQSESVAQSKNANIEMSKGDISIELPRDSKSVKVDDILGFDELLGLNGIVINPPPVSESKEPEFYMDALDIDAESEKLTENPDEIIPENILQHAPADIEELVIPSVSFEQDDLDIKPAAQAVKAPVKAEKAEEIESIDTMKYLQEMKEKTASKEAAKAKPEPEPEPAESIPAAAIATETAEKAENMTLEEFETAVKKLKIMLDNGAISENEFAIEKKKLLSQLY